MADDETAAGRLARLRPVLRFTLIACVVLYVGYLAVLFTLQRQMLFPGTRIVPEVGVAPPGERSERVWIEIEGGARVEAWFLPAPDATASTPAPAVILTHGNGELIDYWGDGVRPYHRMGLSVLLPEYRGYGRSGGAPSKEGLTADAIRFRGWLVARPEVDADRIVYHGFSLGGGVAGAVAAAHPPRAMILQSTFTRIADMTSIPVPAFLIADPFDTASVVREADYPILVVHGTEDGLIPYRQGVRLSELARDGRLVTHGGGHQLMPDQAAFWREVRAHLRRASVVR